MISAWISSLITRMSLTAQISATLSNSASVQTRPAGLCGLQSTNARTSGRDAVISSESKSI